MLHTRHQILSMLQSSAVTTGVSLLNDGPGHRIRIQYQRGRLDRLFEAVVLRRSFDWYRYRLNLYAQLGGIEMIVCAAHDTCVMLPVWCVSEAQVYNEGETSIPLARLADPAFRGSRAGHHLFIGALLSSQPAAFDVLTATSFPRSTRYRIQAKVRSYATLRPGNRLKVM